MFLKTPFVHSARVVHITSHSGMMLKGQPSLDTYERISSRRPKNVILTSDSLRCRCNVFSTSVTNKDVRETLIWTLDPKNRSTKRTNFKSVSKMTYCVMKRIHLELKVVRYYSLKLKLYSLVASQESTKIVASKTLSAKMDTLQCFMQI